MIELPNTDLFKNDYLEPRKIVTQYKYEPQKN